MLSSLTRILTGFLPPTHKTLYPPSGRDFLFFSPSPGGLPRVPAESALGRRTRRLTGGPHPRGLFFLPLSVPSAPVAPAPRAPAEFPCVHLRPAPPPFFFFLHIRLNFSFPFSTMRFPGLRAKSPHPHTAPSRSALIRVVSVASARHLAPYRCRHALVTPHRTPLTAYDLVSRSHAATNPQVIIVFVVSGS